MILYIADKNFKILGTASTSLSGGYVITDDTKKEEVETGIATLDCTVAYTDDTRSDIESWCRAGNYVLAYYGKETASDMDIVNLFMITTTELSVLDHTIKFESEDSGLDLLNNLAKEYTGTEQMSAADYSNKFLEKTGFRLRNNNVSKNPKKLEWTSTDTVTKRLADIAEKFEIELTYGFSVKGLTVSDRWVDIADETGRDTKINLYINKEVNNITVKNTIENLATALYATGKDNLTLIGFTIPEADKDKYQIDPDGNLVSLEALTKWARVDYSSKDSFSGNLYQKFESSDTASQADLYKLAKEKLDSISDIETNYEVDIADLPPGVGIGDRVNIVDDAGNTYISGRILELETSVTDGTKKATLGEYVIKDSGISELVENLASSFANLSKVRELYTWIAYADTIDGDGFSFSPEGKEYLGTAVNQLTEEAGTDPAVYKWVKTKGEQGEKGQPGAPGEKGDPGEDGYSPTVDLSTGESGSTVLTVTNKTGQSSTELKDQAARNEANDARNYADNYINYDETGTMIAAEAVKPIEATKNNVLLTDKDVQIRDGQKVLASYGETIDIGGESEQHVTIAKDKMAVNAGPESLFSVDSFKSGTEIISTWINTDKLTPTEDIYPEISDSIAFSVEDINRTIDLDGSYSYSYNYSFYNKGAKRVWFELEGGETITINEAVGGNSLHYEEFSTSGNEYYNGFELATSEKITRKDIIALRASYDIEFNPAIVDIGQYRTKDVINYMGMNLYDFKALKIGSGIASENNRRDAFTVDFIGNGYFGNTLNVEQDIRAMYVGAAQADVNKISAENISAENISADNITMNIQRGAGKITLTTGAVGFQPRWYLCGNIVQMEVSTKCTGAVASGANIAAGKITGVPAPITKSGVRAVSYYGNNSNISFMGSDGTFYARNAGADALAKGNDCIGGFTYITDGTML
nr:MAG TPA: tail protein [Caudoviricetes sp.]